MCTKDDLMDSLEYTPPRREMGWASIKKIKKTDHNIILFCIFSRAAATHSFVTYKIIFCGRSRVKHIFLIHN